MKGCLPVCSPACARGAEEPPAVSDASCRWQSWTADAFRDQNSARPTSTPNTFNQETKVRATCCRREPRYNTSTQLALEMFKSSCKTDCYLPQTQRLWPILVVPMLLWGCCTHLLPPTEEHQNAQRKAPKIIQVFWAASGWGIIK